MGLPIIAVASGAFGDPDALTSHFADRAELRFVDLAEPDALRMSTRGAAGLVVTLQRVSARVVAALDDTVLVIGRAGVGLDSLDLDAARAKGLTVFNEPAYGAPEVATHAVALLLALQRKLVNADRFVRDGWNGSPGLGRIVPLDDMTAGIVGCGRIGAATIERLTPLVGSILAYDPAPVNAPPPAERVERLDDLLTRSDILSLHLPLTADTRNLIGAPELRMLPAGAIVLNVARGGIVDEKALADCLVSGHLSGAGIDVFDEEPLPRSSPLLSAPNTILTPHCASTSERSQQRLSDWTISDAIDWVTNGTVRHGSLVVEGRTSAGLARSAG